MKIAHQKCPGGTIFRWAMFALGSAGGVAMLLNDDRSAHETEGLALHELIALRNFPSSHRPSQEPQVGFLPGHMHELLAGRKVGGGSAAPRPRSLLLGASRKEHKGRQGENCNSHMSAFLLLVHLGADVLDEFLAALAPAEVGRDQVEEGLDILARSGEVQFVHAAFVQAPATFLVGE